MVNCQLNGRHLYANEQIDIWQLDGLQGWWNKDGKKVRKRREEITNQMRGDENDSKDGNAAIDP